MQCTLCSEFFDETKITEVLRHEYHVDGLVAEDRHANVVSKSFSNDIYCDISKISYNHDTSEMLITFSGDGTYQYKRVPLGVFLLGAKAPSIGGWFASKIKRIYDFNKVNSEDSPAQA